MHRCQQMGMLGDKSKGRSLTGRFRHRGNMTMRRELLARFLDELDCRAPGIQNRRRFLASIGGSATAALALLPTYNAALAARRRAESEATGPIRVESIKVHKIQTRYHDWIHHELQHFYGPSKRVVYQVKTNNGLVGLGESGSLESEAVRKSYIGTNPFDHIGDMKSLGLGTAMYDLMGRAAGVPVHKLFGPRQRRWVKVGSWTVSADPAHMARAVKEYSRRGYTWLKFHLSPFENIFDQLEAMQKVAPPGFKVQFDLTMGGTDDHTPDLLERMSRYPICGAFEDPKLEKDIDAYVELRKRVRVPILYHHSPLGATFEVVRRAADGYMLGHSRIGNAIRKAGMFGELDLPFMLQNVGGEITRTMTVQMHAAFKTATWHTHCDAETWKDDVVVRTIDPTNGMVPVPEGPGLGVEIDPEKLERLEKQKLPKQAKWIIKTTYKNGTRMFNIADPAESIFMVRPDRRKLLPLSYDAPLSTEWWDDDGSKAYRTMFSRIQKQGVVLEKPGSAD
ncbi:MAG: mandelate racemase/muconate lactonizing enzyme family protein [Planctomycetaceae bacterium]|nr:mandelate racemase/muconate lactonizing enzyme family protein [Planctomycetaceae bacterium]